ncbi:MAG: sulfite reductase subunit alpha [Verrucomicrobiae bacterium]|nr:sulfite reductase subunit alpha [Verrucomicrobiae bacterium]
MNQPVATFIPENAPFDAGQRLWLNGYMAGLLAGKHFPPAILKGAANGGAQATVPLVILFGSQTGTAEKIAKQLAKESRTRGCNGRALEAGAHAGIDWSQETNLLIVTSTYGDGDMPDNAQAFWDWLQTDAAKSLTHLNFSVLALGDTNYEQFCAAGKKIDARLEALGAKRIHPLEVCDLDYEAKVKAWSAGALAAFAPTGGPAASPEAIKPAAVEGYSKTNPFPAKLITNRKLNGEGSQKETRHFEISLEGSGLNYEAGDALGVWPHNCPELVAEILAALGCDGEEAVPTAKGELPLRQALTSFYDVSRPAAELQKFFSERNPAFAALLTPERKDDLKKFLWGRGVVDFLVENPGVKLSPKEFTALLKPLAPRLYSISSSPKAHAGQVHLTINVVRYDSLGRPRKGAASTFLADRVNDGIPVPVFIQTAHGFRPPADGGKPVIMVGPGTGVAPFRGFLHERSATGATGKNWLFFGEQRAATDFYYRDELEKMLADGRLTKLSTAFSRDQAEKIYVQTRMLENAAELWAWLEAGAHFYVCGDASRMARDVDDALHKIIESAGGKSAEDAKAYVAKLKSDKRYQRDVY